MHSYPWKWMDVSDQLHAPASLSQDKEPPVPIEEEGGPHSRSGRHGVK
jgi:hypothetical protein